MKTLLTFVLMICAQGAWAGEGYDQFLIPVVPNAEVTPGDFCNEQDEHFLTYRYDEKIPYCERHVNTWLKNKIYKEYQVPQECRHRYTIDHMVPLALGGNNNPHNLWPEHVLVKATRQALENSLYHQVKRNEITTEEALQVIIDAKTKLNLDLSHVEGCG